MLGERGTQSLNPLARVWFLLSAFGPAMDAGSVSLARKRGNEASIAVGYRVLADSLPAGDGPGKASAAQEALDQTTGPPRRPACAPRLPFIGNVRQKLVGIA